MALPPTPVTVVDIITAQQNSIQELNDREVALNQLLAPGQTTGTVINAIADISAKRLAIMAAANQQILASADLAGALDAMRQATTDMKNTAAVMTTVTGVATNIGTYLGYASGVLAAVRGVTGGTGPGISGQ